MGLCVCLFVLFIFFFSSLHADGRVHSVVPPSYPDAPELFLGWSQSLTASYFEFLTKSILELFFREPLDAYTFYLFTFS